MGREGRKRPRKAIPPKIGPGETSPWRQSRIPEFASDTTMSEEGGDVDKPIKLTESSTVMSVFNRNIQWKSNPEVKSRLRRQNYIFSYDGTPLYLSNLEDAKDEEFLAVRDIRYIVSVRMELDTPFANKQIHDYQTATLTQKRAGRKLTLKQRENPVLYGGVEYFTLRVPDAPSGIPHFRKSLDEVMAWIHRRIVEWGKWPSDVGKGVIRRSAQNAILIHCTAGRSRSASLMIAFMMKYGGFNLLGAFGLLQAKDSKITLGYETLHYLNMLQDYERSEIIPQRALEYLDRLSRVGNMTDMRGIPPKELAHIAKLSYSYGFSAAESSFPTFRDSIKVPKHPDDHSYLLMVSGKIEATEEEEDQQDPLPEFEAKREEEEEEELLF